jgi:GntR family transcriptional regulator/MocR family aminotransferase
MGVTMTMPRRVALLEWARAEKAWILEDDYDSEFRYAGPPLTALAGIDGGDRVIYIGTFSKTLFPSLRLAYIVMPIAARAAILAARATLDRFTPVMMEKAVAELMADSTFSAHIRRVRKRCVAARDVVANTLVRASKGALRVEVPTQGLHLTAMLPRGVPAAAADRARSAANVVASLISEARIGRGDSDGFVLGFAGHALANLEEAAARLGRSARQVVDEG